MLAETPGREELTRRLCRSLRGHEAVAAAVEGCPARPLSTTAWASAGKPPTSQLISSVEPAAAGSRRLWRPPPALGERTALISPPISWWSAAPNEMHLNDLKRRCNCSYVCKACTLQNETGAAVCAACGTAARMAFSAADRHPPKAGVLGTWGRRS